MNCYIFEKKTTKFSPHQHKVTEITGHANTSKEGKNTTH